MQSDDETALEEAWIELHEANAVLGWHLGPTTYEPRFEFAWTMYAFDPREKPMVGRRTRAWTSIGRTEAECVRSMAYSLREIRDGRVPR